MLAERLSDTTRSNGQECIACRQQRMNHLRIPFAAALSKQSLFDFADTYRRPIQ
jgi:hypothetical protein